MWGFTIFIDLQNLIKLPRHVMISTNHLSTDSIGLGCGMLNVHTSAVMVSPAIALSPANHSETRQPALNAVHFGNSKKSHYMGATTQ